MRIQLQPPVRHYNHLASSFLTIGCSCRNEGSTWSQSSDLSVVINRSDGFVLRFICYGLVFCIIRLYDCLYVERITVQNGFHLRYKDDFLNLDFCSLHMYLTNSPDGAVLHIRNAHQNISIRLGNNKSVLRYGCDAFIIRLPDQSCIVFYLVSAFIVACRSKLDIFLPHSQLKACSDDNTLHICLIYRLLHRHETDSFLARNDVLYLDFGSSFADYSHDSVPDGHDLLIGRGPCKKIRVIVFRTATDFKRLLLSGISEQGERLRRNRYFCHSVGRSFKHSDFTLCEGA